MNNDNQIPEMPKPADNIQQQTPVSASVQDPIVIQSAPQEEKKPNEAKQMMGEVKETTSKEVQNMSKFLNDVKKYITTKNSSELLSLLWRLLLVAGFIIVLYLPFYLVNLLGFNLLILFGVNFTNRLGDIWNSIWYIAYSILAIVLFFILCKDRFYKFVKLQEDEKKIKEGINK